MVAANVDPLVVDVEHAEPEDVTEEVPVVSTVTIDELPLSVPEEAIVVDKEEELAIVTDAEEDVAEESVAMLVIEVVSEPIDEESVVEGCSASFPSLPGRTSGVVGANFSVTFRAFPRASAVNIFGTGIGEWVESPNSSSKASCSKLVTSAALFDAGVGGLTVETAEGPGGARELLGVGGLSPEVPSSSIFFHVGRMMPVRGSYAKIWLLCGPFERGSLQLSTVIGAGEEGSGSYVAQ